MFKIDPAAGCTLANVELTSAALQIGKPDPPRRARKAMPTSTADIEFTCTDTARAAFIELALFSSFSGMQRIDVQVATPKGQAKRTLKRPASRITLAR